MSETVRLGENARRGLAALRRAVRRVPAQAEPVQLRLEKGAEQVEDDEVLVLVLGQHGGFVSRTTVRGRPIDLRELGLRLAGAEVAVEGIARRPEVESPRLTATEASLLDEAGLVDGGGGGPGAFEKSRIEYELLLHRSLTLEEAAKILAVNPSRLRQRLGQRTMYGIKVSGSWRVPRFQFEPKRKNFVRGIEKVLPRIRPDAHPLAVVTWFSVPHQDLVVGKEERRVTPLAWLAAGMSPETVARLANEI